jgi:hypothetical protein
MYKTAGQPGAGGAPDASAGSAGNGAQGGQQQKPKDDVVDAEFVDVDPKDKK